MKSGCNVVLYFFMGVFSTYATTSHAALPLTLIPQNSGTMSTDALHGGTTWLTDQTPFLQQGPNQLPEIVVDPETGLSYYHMIIGDPAAGFIQETYIQNGFGTFTGGTGSAVGGDGGSSGGNGADPLDLNATIDTANAEANPQRVLVRQLISDGEISMEFLKDKYDRKPFIMQALNTLEISSQFQIDMRNSTYGDVNSPGVIFHIFTLTDQPPGIGGDFNLVEDAPNANVTAGRYTYGEGAGPGGSNGGYSYLEGGYDHLDQNWHWYFEAVLNNPWSYNTNRPQ